MLNSKCFITPQQFLLKFDIRSFFLSGIRAIVNLTFAPLTDGLFIV